MLLGIADHQKGAGGCYSLKRMPKYELTKTIEAVKLNQRTLRPLGAERFSIPFGAVLENLSVDRDIQQFFYLGEPYECPLSVIQSALKELS